MISTIIIYLTIVMVMSIICFVAYGMDKQITSLNFLVVRKLRS